MPTLQFRTPLAPLSITGMPDELILETQDGIGIARFNRPEKLNALNLATMVRLVEALERYDSDPNIRCMLIAGDERAFAAGAEFNLGGGRTDVAYLTIGARRPPTPETVNRCIRLLRGNGYESVVTNALGPAETLPFVDAGFSVRERLHLLAHELSEIPTIATAIEG